MAELSLKQCVIAKFRQRFWQDPAIISQLRRYMHNRAYIGNAIICIAFDQSGQIATHYPLPHDRRLHNLMYHRNTMLVEMAEHDYFEFRYEFSPATRYEIYRVAVESAYPIDVYVIYKIIAGTESLASIMLPVTDLRILVQAVL